MKLFVVLAMFSVGVWAEVPTVAPAPGHKLAVKSHHQLPVKRSQKLLARALALPGGIDDTASANDDMDVYVGYRKPKLVQDSDQDQLSDYVKIRLLIARVRALQKYQETWS